MPLRYQGGGGDGAPEPAVPWNLAAVTGPDPPVATPAPHSPGQPTPPRAGVGRRADVARGAGAVPRSTVAAEQQRWRLRWSSRPIKEH